MQPILGEKPKAAYRCPLDIWPLEKSKQNWTVAIENYSLDTMNSIHWIVLIE